MASKRVNSSPVWNYLDKVNSDKVVCKLCKESLKYGASTSNLTKHIRCKHPIEYEKMQNENSFQPSTASNKRQLPAQPTIQDTFNKKQKYNADSARKKELDQKVMYMIVQDLQPFSVVEDKGFQALVKCLDSRYELPSRRELARTHLPKIYDTEITRVKQELENTNSVAITTDIWTSRNTKGFITVTAHYISSSWELKSVVLETVRMIKAHTAINIAEELTTICNNWNMLDKVCCVITDNAANMIAAVKNHMNLRHVPCFAHTLNLIVRDSIKNTEEVQHVQDKIKHIVTFFHQSVKASDKLSQLQEQHGQPTMKLIQDVDTRWNSTFYMMQRFVQQNQLITTTLCLMGKNDMCLNNEELDLVSKTVAVLEPFEEATKEMSVEKFTSLSKIIPMVRGLQECMNFSEDMELQRLYRTFSLGKELHQQMSKRFQSMETSFFVGAACILDPRLKKVPFADASNVKMIEERLISLMKVNRPAEKEQEPSTSTHVDPSQTENTSTHTKKSSIWARFDAKIEKIALVSSSNPTTGPYLEMRRYIEESPIPREEDPLAWWDKHGGLFPKLQEQAKKFLCAPATSVPSERLFSKAGELVSQRRSCLKDNHVNMILFLNKNTT